MPPAATKPPTRRKRNRKRKRRAVSTSSSSSDSSSSDSGEDEAPKTTTKVVHVPSLSKSQLESDSSSDSDSSESSSSDEEDTAADIPRGRQPQNVTPKTPRQFSPSPSPPSAALPSFLPQGNTGDDAGSKEKGLKDRFRQFWMTSVADGFKDDLEEIRKEPNLGTSRLALLIDSLAAGADVFSSSSNERDTLNEMDVVLN